MFLLWLKGFLLLWTVSVGSGDSKTGVRLESVTNIAGEEDTLVVCNFRLVGRERLFNGTVNFLLDFDHNYVAAVDVYTFKNGEWIQNYIKVRTTPCDMLTNYIRHYTLPPDADTNLFVSEDNCRKPGKYYLKNVAIATDNWPTYWPRGLAKVHVYYMLNGKKIGGFEVICNLSDKLT